MKNKRRFIKRESNGITLIALVITIIVLLILAGVSISMLTGQNGILTQAQNAKNKTEEAEEKERIQLAITEAQLGDGGYQDLTEENLQKEIDEEFGSGEVRVYPNEKNAFSFIFQNKEANYRLEKDGTINKIDIALKINNVEEFRSFMNEVNGGNTFENQYVYLLENIDLSSETWDVIGSYTDDTTNNAFAGIFEGNNRTINGLNIEKDGALFAYNTGTIRDIILESGSITGVRRVAGIVAINNGTIENCHNKGVNISITGTSGGGAGITARNTGNIVYCSNSTSINVENGSYVGGITGAANSGKISNCYNTGDISASHVIGGIAGGVLENTTIEYCYNTGNIVGEGKDGIYNSTNSGGIAGHCYGKIIGCYNTGTIEIASINGGGIAGMASNSRGGDAGIFNCYNVGKIENKGDILGNISGGSYGPVKNCYFSREITDLDGVSNTNENSDIEVYEKSLSYMKTNSFVNDLNKSNEAFVMDTGINNGYPILKWQID